MLLLVMKMVRIWAVILLDTPKESQVEALFRSRIFRIVEPGLVETIRQTGDLDILFRMLHPENSCLLENSVHIIDYIPL